MLHFSDLQILPPTNWRKFETLCCDLWRKIWEDQDIQKNGRQGQEQDGVDIHGRLYNSKLCGGIQCKCNESNPYNRLTESDVKKEVQKAKNFEPKLSKFIIATTGPKDTKIEEFARKITEDHLKIGLFSVHILGWDDIKEKLEDFPDVRDKYYPQGRNENLFKRETAGKILETVIRPLRDYAEVIKSSFKNGEYIKNLENRSLKLELELNGNEFIKNCTKESNRFHLKDGNLVFIYKRDEIFNKIMPQIIAHLDSYKEHFLALKTTIKSLSTSNIPISFERDIALLIIDPYKKTDFAEDGHKEEYLFQLYATVITGKKSFNGHDWATGLKNEKSKEILDIITKDSYSNELFKKIEFLKNEIIVNIDELIDELNYLDEELQNVHCL